ncbi:MAG TPA: hypothetical protein VM925_30890 [Labilithrix sp.]|nr:hypothetical protein [Labilithrix sp.]
MTSTTHLGETTAARLQAAEAPRPRAARDIEGAVADIDLGAETSEEPAPSN